MNKKSILIFSFLLSALTISFGQEEENILSAPEGWLSERLDFPLSFAPSIDLVGFEDLRFAPKWSDSTQQEFWTYKFVWFTEKEFELSESTLSTNVDAYYNGLMGIDTKGGGKADGPKETLSIFIKTDEGYEGKIRVHDAFFTKKEMTFHVKVKEKICPETKVQYVLFELSPKNFDDAIWKMFDEVKLTTDCP